MAKAKRPPEIHTATFNFKTKYLRHGDHSAFIWIPEPLLTLVGYVVAHWGNFEMHFDHILASLVAHVKLDVPDLHIMKFKRRRKLFCELLETHVRSKKPEVATALKEIADRAGDLHRKRNMVAHGLFTCSILPKSSQATNFRTIDARSGKEMPIGTEVLERLWHDIAHLTGNLVQEFKPLGKFETPVYTFPDTELLRVSSGTNQPSHPNPDKHEPPPKSSEA